jgi:hypothetical protein
MARHTFKAMLDSLFWQCVAVILACIYIAVLHFDNNGLWMQGDAPRHAITGFFWWDLLTSLPTNPLAYGISYYARYPVIAPVTYPPLFHILEGLFYQIYGPSPFVAKTLVLAFACMACF